MSYFVISTGAAMQVYIEFFGTGLLYVFDVRFLLFCVVLYTER